MVKLLDFRGNKHNLIEAKKLTVRTKDSDSNIEKILDLGFVGSPTKINMSLIKKYSEKNYIPVISPLGVDNNKNTLNINADTVAGFIAGIMKSKKLLLLTDVPGIMDKNNKLISKISLKKAKQMINKNYITGGMKPKVKTCIEALKKRSKGKQQY